MSEVNVAGAIRWVGPGDSKLARDRESMFVGAFEHERAGVGHERRVETGCNVTIQRYPGQTSHAVDQLGSGHYGGIDPIDVGEIASGSMMVDVDEETIF